MVGGGVGLFCFLVSPIWEVFFLRMNISEEVKTKVSSENIIFCEKALNPSKTPLLSEYF